MFGHHFADREKYGIRCLPQDLLPGIRQHQRSSVETARELPAQLRGNDLVSLTTDHRDRASNCVHARTREAMVPGRARHHVPHPWGNPVRVRLEGGRGAASRMQRWLGAEHQIDHGGKRRHPGRIVQLQCQR